ncbi:hypothetical protein M5M_16580 [Simiduia agarivorans SA1 = DSM 21679]|uniref:Solute-binding protein family 3/N-terminal domain-containing protein n=2 Tax=Simiduia TaxID=447467 RepID=K4KN39_SIMAS|nr:hypothetical protein M5M_16580 [Simiduia agarivorans SA1 = DSM 21679]
MFPWLVFAEADSRPVVSFSVSVWPALMASDGRGLFSDLISQALPQYQIEYQVVPWRRATQMLVAGDVDGQIGTYRAALINQVDPGNVKISNRVPIYLERVEVWCHSGRALANWRVELRGLSYAWPRGYDYDVHFAIPKAMEVHDTEQGIRMLLARRIDCYIDDSGDIAHRLPMDAVQAHRLNTAPIGSHPLFVTFMDHEQGREIAQALDAGLTRLRATGEARRLFTKWGVLKNYPESSAD